ncbi:hypothetical protein AK812_SmicGene17488 [Symbiodinium microadriaticum]|uniref:Uncharacterized protein n=1 Tax=Symbiodinium microadriaticum TaxID=2951 RepID=A0A1Q9DXJ1_SYMMI|nr:hypothetical protein AK812_SmicGene17488 [Symbiodinium microadriaticum]
MMAAYDTDSHIRYPNRVDVYAPAGYKFLLSCFAPGERQRLQFNFVSCRERWTLFQGREHLAHEDGEKHLQQAN